MMKKQRNYLFPISLVSSKQDFLKLRRILSFALCLVWGSLLFCPVSFAQYASGSGTTSAVATSDEMSYAYITFATEPSTILAGDYMNCTLNLVSGQGVLVNTGTWSDDNVILSIYNNPSTSTLVGTTSRLFSSGVAAFNDSYGLTIGSLGELFTLKATLTSCPTIYGISRAFDVYPVDSVDVVSEEVVLDTVTKDFAVEGSTLEGDTLDIGTPAETGEYDTRFDNLDAAVAAVDSAVADVDAAVAVVGANVLVVGANVLVVDTVVDNVATDLKTVDGNVDLILAEIVGGGTQDLGEYDARFDSIDAALAAMGVVDWADMGDMVEDYRAGGWSSVEWQLLDHQMTQQGMGGWHSDEWTKLRYFVDGYGNSGWATLDWNNLESIVTQITSEGVCWNDVQNLADDYSDSYWDATDWNYLESLATSYGNAGWNTYDWNSLENMASDYNSGGWNATDWNNLESVAQNIMTQGVCWNDVQNLADDYSDSLWDATD